MELGPYGAACSSSPTPGQAPSEPSLPTLWKIPGILGIKTTEIQKKKLFTNSQK